MVARRQAVQPLVEVEQQIARGVVGERFARTLTPISRLLAAPWACARTARKMKKGGRETSVRMRNGGEGDEGSSGRRKTRADGSRHVTWSATARGRRSSARSASQTPLPGRISRGFFLCRRAKTKKNIALISTRRRSAFRPARAAAACINAHASVGKTLRGVNEGMLTSGDTSACRRREECAPGRASPTRWETLHQASWRVSTG